MESNNQQKDGFRYTYSAKDQEEIRSIRQKYVPREEDKMERLRRLDRSVAVKARAWSVAVGILGVLVLGFGMSLFMSEFGAEAGHSGKSDHACWHRLRLGRRRARMPGVPALSACCPA